MSVTPSAGDAQYDASTGTYRAPDLQAAAVPPPTEARRSPIGRSAVVIALVLLALLVVLWLAVVLA